MRLHTLALALAVLACSGCMAVEAIKRHSNESASAISVAVNQAVFDTATPTGYYEYFGELAYTHRASGLCEKADLTRAVETREIRCYPSLGRADPSCTDAMGCVRIELSPAVLDNPRYRAAAMQAMTDPCGALHDPRHLKWGAYPSAIGISAKSARHNLRCGWRNRPRATSIEEAGAMFVLTVTGLPRF